MDTDQLQ